MTTRNDTPLAAVLMVTPKNLDRFYGQPDAANKVQSYYSAWVSGNRVAYDLLHYRLVVFGASVAEGLALKACRAKGLAEIHVHHVLDDLDARMAGIIDAALVRYDLQKVGLALGQRLVTEHDVARSFLWFVVRGMRFDALSSAGRWRSKICRKAQPYREIGLDAIEMPSRGLPDSDMAGIGNDEPGINGIAWQHGDSDGRAFLPHIKAAVARVAAAVEQVAPEATPVQRSRQLKRSLEDIVEGTIEHTLKEQILEKVVRRKKLADALQDFEELKSEIAAVERTEEELVPA